MPKMGRVSVRQGGAARLCGFVAARHASFAVATHRRLGSRGAKALPRRSVDGEATRCARTARDGPRSGRRGDVAHGPRRALAQLAVDTICRARGTG
jgi:hypothetical protein